MTTTSQTWTEEIVDLAGAKIQLVKGGSGDPLLILHDEMGYHGWLRYHEALAQNYTLYIPSHPGFGKSERLDWIMYMRDLAGWYMQALDELNLGQVNLMGFSFGAWLAAEMATMCPERFKKMVLVSAMGIKPPEGEIFDIFLVTSREYFQQAFHDPENTPEYQELYGGDPTPDQVELWETSREQACRLTWRPYMHYPALPQLLRRLKHLPTLIIWGRDDKIVPLSAANVYKESIAQSQLVVLNNCGHHPEMEKTDDFVKQVKDFLG